MKKIIKKIFAPFIFISVLFYITCLLIAAAVSFLFAYIFSTGKEKEKTKQAIQEMDDRILGKDYP